VAADVLVRALQVAVGVEDRAGVEAAGRGEGGLRGAEASRQRRDHVAPGRRSGRQRGENAADGGEGGLAANAAARGGEQVAREPGLVQDHAGGGHRVDQVGRRLTGISAAPH
jgi:hypothetical protein